MELKPLDLTVFIIFALSIITPAACACEDGWYQFGNTCFYISDARYNINDMTKICTAKNASLWTVHNETERQWVGKIIQEGSRIMYWIDLQLINRRWTWGDRSVTYSKTTAHWYRNQEGSTSSSNKCAAMFSYPPQVGQIQQKRCTDGWGTICTRPIDMLDFCDIANGWHYVDGFCLKFYSTPMNWQDARQTCKTKGGDLTMYKSYLELTNLYQLVPCRTSDNIAWIGLSDTVTPRTWRWVNNDTVRYSRWYPYGNQILTNGSTCAATDPINSWQWRHYTCDQKHPFICNRSLGICPSGWLPFQDHCYQPNVVPKSQKTWFDAKTYCEAMGTELLIIDSDAEQQFINSTLNTLQAAKAWLGFSDMTTSDVLQWVNGKIATDASMYQRWDTNFPAPKPKRFDCGIVTRGGRDSRWSNGYCYNYNSFFCEMIVTVQPFLPTPQPATGHCEAGWRYYRNKCYYFGPAQNQSLKTWGDSLEYCKAKLGSLVIFNDPYEISFVTGNQAKDKTSWIGMKYDVAAQKLMWVDGTSPGQNNIQETNFYPGEPDDITHGQLCIQIVGGRRDFSGSWDDGNCSVAKAFICEKDAYPGGSAMPTTPPVPNSWSVYCGPVWVYDSTENFCYQTVLNNPRTWTAARSYCKNIGGDLLSISGRTEQNFVQAMLSTGQYASIQVNFWIGATDQGREGGWRWTDNSPFRYLNWHPGEPNNFLIGSVPEDCAEMVPAWNYQWNDKFCSKEQLFICKKAAMVTSPSTITPPTGAAKMANCPGVPMMSGNYSLVSTTAFSAATSRDARHGPDSCRWYTGSTGAWSAKTMDTNQYISASFYNTIVVKGIITAGRTDTDEWVTKYTLQFKESYYADWLDYMDPPGTVKIFNGNTDSSTPVTNMLLFPFEARQVRVKPVLWQSGISVRWEILGCLEESCTPDYAISGPLVIPDNAIQASSNADVAHDKNAARLRAVTPGVVPSCWKPLTNDYNQWIKADLGGIFFLRGVTIRGDPAGQSWVSQYRFQYSMTPADSSYQYYQEPYLMPKTITGNTDNTNTSTYIFKSHLQARYVKIIPKAWVRDIALSFDVLVCPNSCNTIPLVSGSVPVPDDAFRASSIADPRHAAFRARLNKPSGGGYAGAWRPLFNDKNQFIQVDLGYSVQVAAVATQGSFDSQDFIKTYQLSYSSDGASWTKYFELGTQPRVFTANWDNKAVRKHYMMIPFIARYVRLWPQTWNNNIGVRLEYYGCPGPDSGTQIGCYADNIHQRDLAYEPYTDPRVGMWPPMCIHHCFRKGYYFAGIQAQFKCFCGNTYGRYGPATDCNMACVPRKKFFCGGPQSSVVYSTGLAPQFKVCPSNWSNYKNRCYLVLMDQKTWYDAQADCHLLGGDLASPNSQQEQDFVYSLVQFTNGTNVWIGFNDQQNENVYQWSDGRQVMYTNWGLNQPSHTANSRQDCVMMQANSSGSWSDGKCRSLNRYVCQMDKRNSIEPSPTPARMGCPDGWGAYRWSCYLYADAPRSWQDAHTACQSFGSILVTVMDRYEQSYLSSVLGGRSGEYWMDVSDVKVPGTFVYADANRGLVYTNWAANKPDATSQCVSMGSGSSAGLWYNHNCTAMKGMVCKKHRTGFTTPAIPPAPVVKSPCDNGTIQTSNYCYQINVRKGNLRLSWQEALNDCTSKGSNLASFHAAADIDTVWRQGLVGIQGGFWIGLNDRDTESGYKWTDRTVGNVFNWDQGQPDNYQGSEDCVEMSPQTSKWNDASCQVGRNWICMTKRGSHFTAPPTVIAPTAGPSGTCAGNWTNYNNNCYYLTDGQGDQGRSWRNARKYCQQNSGDLASLANIQEQQFVYMTLANNVSAYWLWLGFNEIDSTRGYSWSDGSPTTFTNWDVNEPNDHGGQEDCVVMLIRDGKWLDIQCSSKFGFVCKRPLHPTPRPPIVVTTPMPGNCPTGFSGLGSRCYKIFTQPAVNWTTALNNCHKLGKGYSLASVRNSVENAFLTTQLATMHVFPWLGLKKQYGNQLQWINNDDVTYTNFAYGEPNGQGNERCIQMMSNGRKAGQWNDLPCSSANAYICQTVRSTAIPTPESIPNLCDTKQGQTQFINNCYFVNNISQSWNASNNQCMARGGYLSSINSVYEQSYIFYVMSQYAHNMPLWIGLNDRKSPGIYSWSDSWPVQYTNWDAGQPVQGSAGGCVMFNTTGRWSVQNCTMNMTSVCKISQAVPSLTPPPPNGTCALGWYSYINKCYFMGVNRAASVLDATLFCQQQQATLVSVHNKTVNQYLVRTLASLSPQSTSFWTSLHKSLNSGFQWLDGTPVQYTNWRPGEPSVRGWAGNDENCAEVFLADGKWNDEDCNSKRAFICEKQQGVDTGGGINVPTPIPRTPPISLPSQVVPTPPTRPGNRPPGWSVLTTPPTPGALQTGSSWLPTIHVGPYSGPATSSAQQGGANVTKQVLGMSPGSLAGVVIGVVVVILLAILVAMYWRRRTTQGQQQTFGLNQSLGFENKTYSYNKEREEVVDNGSRGFDTSMRTMSESSS